MHRPARLAGEVEHRPAKADRNWREELDASAVRYVVAPPCLGRSKSAGELEHRPAKADPSRREKLDAARGRNAVSLPCQGKS